MVDGGDGEGGFVAHGELVVPGGHGSVLFELVDAALHGMTQTVGLEVEGGRAPAFRPFGPAASLADTLVALAATADDASIVDVHLARIARLTADTVTAVDYASITAWRGQGYTTVAASSDLAWAVDQAQYADSAGPCLNALEVTTPVGVPDIAATMSWPKFYRTATKLGLHASLSIPLFAGSGAPIAVLNLYSRDTATMAPLIADVRTVFRGRLPPAGNRPDGVDAGARQLLIGLAQALTVRDTIQQAAGVLMARDDCSATDAYRRLRLRAAEAGVSLADSPAARVRVPCSEHSCSNPSRLGFTFDSAPSGNQPTEN